MNRAERRRRKKSAKGVHKPVDRQGNADDAFLLNLAMEHIAHGHISKANEVCSQLLRTNPNHPDALHLSGLVALKKGDYLDSINLLSRTVGVVPTYTEAISNLGLAYRALGRFGEALKCFRRAIKLNSERAEVHNNLGLTLHDLRKYRPALTSFEKAISLRPEYSDASFNKGNTYRELLEYQQAIASYEQALRINPDNFEALGNLGVVLQETGQLKKATDVYMKVISGKPEDSAAYNNLGTVLRDLGDFEGAIQNYTQAISINPAFEEAYVNLGLAYREIGQLENSRDSLRAAIDLKDMFVEAHYQLGNTFIKLQDSESALNCFQAALRLRPSYIDAYNAVGRVLLGLGRLEEAATNFNEVLRYDTRDEKFGVGLILAHLGEAETPTRTPVSFMQNYYRQNVNRWDRVSNKYFGHVMVEEAVKASFESKKSLDLLDMGCGTGSMGKFLRPYARTLTGIDISVDMLEKAQSKEMYDELLNLDLVSYLMKTTKIHDLVVAAAVLIHFGNLEEVFEGLQRCLRSGGKVIFTLFANQGEEDFVINSEGWFSHDSNYVTELTSTFDFSVISVGQKVHEYDDKGEEIMANSYIIVRS